MTVTYNHVQSDPATLIIEHIDRFNEDGTVSWIPIDLANSDYQAYLDRDKPQVEHLTEIPTV